MCGDKLRDLHLAFRICHFQYLSFTAFCHSCVILLSCAVAIFIWCLMCSFLIYVKLLLSFCSVMFLCRYSAAFLAIFLCHCLLSCCSVLFSAIFFDVFFRHSVVVIYSRVLLKTFFDMGEEGHA